MKITKIEVHNYRNLDGAKLSLADDCNFIVGENNLGKSNLLSLLNILFTSRSFRFEDFKDVDIPIEIQFQLKLDPIEIGHFQDLFDSDNYYNINIAARQLNGDDNINFYHVETETYITPHLVRCINFVHYDSLRNPVSEINFDKGKGVGRFLRNIISKYLESNNVSNNDFLDEDKVNGLFTSINEKISKIKSFKDFGVIASSDEDTENLLSKIVTLKDAKGDSLTKSGYGIQFLILVVLSILDRIQTIKKQKSNIGVFENEELGSKAISLVLGLDEPEIHLHPYMQRSLIKYLNTILSNKNGDFKNLVKELFDIDDFIGQLIVVTHSPNIILNDYKQIVRFYSEGGITKVISGTSLSLSEQLHKHLYLHFPFIKEAFFSRAAIFVEGDSEYASFPHFANKMSIDLDDLGICVLQAGGDAIAQLIDLGTLFGIPSVGITDKDDEAAASKPNLFVTTLRDFEEEIISLVDSGKEDILRAILCAYDASGESREMDAKALNKRAVTKYKLSTTPFTIGLKLSDIPLADHVSLKSFYVTWYSINKSYPLGMIIGEHFSINEIPAIYQTVINEAKKLTENV